MKNKFHLHRNIQHLCAWLVLISRHRYLVDFQYPAQSMVERGRVLKLHKKLDQCEI